MSNQGGDAYISPTGRSYSMEDVQSEIKRMFPPTSKEPVPSKQVVGIDVNYSQLEMRLAQKFQTDPDFQRIIGGPTSTHEPAAHMREAQVLPTESTGCG